MAALQIVGKPRQSRAILCVSVILFAELACGSGDPLSVTGVTLDPSSLTFTVGGPSVKLVATVSPASAPDNSVTWSSSDPAVATVTNKGVVAPVAAGTATITVRTTDGGKTATCAVKVNAIAVTGLTLDQTTLNLVTGSAAVTLVAAVSPADATNKTVTWLSSNTAVATVSASGAVTAVAAGTATITAKTVDGSRTATCTVTVTAAHIAVTGVTLEHATLNVTIGARASLTATVTPANASDKVVAWSSDRPDVAAVDSTGHITIADITGTATITVTTDEGSFTATCLVTVTQPTHPVTGVTLDHTTLAVAIGASGTLTPTVAPANAENKAVTFSSNNEAVATVNAAGVVTGVASGTATITVTSTERPISAHCTVTVRPDTVTSVTMDYPITGQVVISWTDALDKNATGVEVTITGEGGSSKTVAMGTKTVAFSGLKLGNAYTCRLRALGASGTASDPVTKDVTLVKVVKLLSMNASTWIVMDSFGSSTDGVATHDVIRADRLDISKPSVSFPKNYRWVLMPGLADPTDPSLVSLKNEEYTATGTGGFQWVETERYLHLHPEITYKTRGPYDHGQYQAWCDYGPPDITPLGFADLIDTNDPAFNKNSTFKMIPRSDIPGSVSFQWLGDPTGTRLLIDACFHMVAMDAATTNQMTWYPRNYSSETAWFLEDVADMTP